MHTPSLSLFALFTAAALAQDGRLQLREGQEVYTKTVVAEGTHEGPKRTTRFAHGLELELLHTVEAPLDGAYPTSLRVAALEAYVDAHVTRLRKSGEREEHPYDLRFELPARQAGLTARGVLLPDASAPSGKRRGGGFGRLSGAGRGLDRRAMIDLHADTWLNVGRLQAGDAWEAATEFMLPGYGWDDDFLPLRLHERYRVVESEGGRTVIEAELVRLEVPGATLDVERHVKQRFNLSRWILMLAAELEGSEGSARGARRIVLVDGQVREATLDLELAFAYEDQRFTLRRRETLAPSAAAAAALQRLERAAQAEDQRYALELRAETAAKDAALSLEVSGELVVHWAAEEGAWIALLESARVAGTLRDHEGTPRGFERALGILPLEVRRGVGGFALSSARMQAYGEAKLPAWALEPLEALLERACLGLEDSLYTGQGPLNREQAEVAAPRLSTPEVDASIAAQWTAPGEPKPVADVAGFEALNAFTQGELVAFAVTREGGAVTLVPEDVALRASFPSFALRFDAEGLVEVDYRWTVKEQAGTFSVSLRQTRK